jgi:primosomal replication protein N
LDNVGNYVGLHGIPAEEPKFSHFGGGESFFVFPLDVQRLSGARDRINIAAAKPDIDSLDVSDFGRRDIDVEGELRSFNNTSGTGSRLVITVLAKKLTFSQGPDRNIVRLSGVLCKRPNLRQTPLGSTICDLMLAVPRRTGRSDYLPCIAWGATALLAAGLPVGGALEAEGRIQSRKYMKVQPDGTGEERTAFEVSIRTLTPTS